MNKKGSVIDILYIILVLFGLSIVLLVGFKMYSNITNDLAAQYPDVASATLAQSSLQQMFLNYDKLLMFIFVMGIIGTVILAFFLDSHPVFTIIAVIVLILFTLFAGVLSNLYEDIEQSPSLQNEVAQYPITSFFWLHLPKFTVLSIVVVIVVTFAKGRSQGGAI